MTFAKTNDAYRKVARLQIQTYVVILLYRVKVACIDRCVYVLYVVILYQFTIIFILLSLLVFHISDANMYICTYILIYL